EDGIRDKLVTGVQTCALPFFTVSGRRAYCAPKVYRAQQSRLYRNNGDGTFANVTAAAGMATQFGTALGAVAADFNGDGWLDLFRSEERRVGKEGRFRCASEAW